MDSYLSVSTISGARAMELVKKHHYSRRKVGSKFSFGLIDDGHLCGCCVYSIPASYTLCNGVCGREYRSHVLELSRLVVTTKHRNAASFLIGQSLRMLSRCGNWVIVSYADCNDHVGHVGYVYQATNWIYTGQGTAEPKWIHPDTGEVVSFTRRHIDRKALAMGLNWKDLVKGPQSGKHRYVTFAGDRRFKRDARRAMRYEEMPYPKGDTMRHESLKESDVLFTLEDDEL